MKMDLATSFAANTVARARRPWLSSSAQLVLDALATVGAMMVGSYSAWATIDFWAQPLIWPGVGVLCSILLSGKHWLVRRRNRAPAEQLGTAVLWVGLVYAASMAHLLLSRSYYSRSFLITSLMALLLWQIIDAFIVRGSNYNIKLAGIPSPAVERLKGLPGVELLILPTPQVGEAVDGLVVDMHQPLRPEWARFVAEWAASGRLVFHAAAIYETATSRVPLAYLSDGWVGELFNGSGAYLSFKRVLDVLVVLVTLPLTVPICLIIALAIWIDSGRPIFFWQWRVGQYGRPFRLVKFRSMRPDAESHGAQFASDNDERVTSVGRIIRRLRLDELPQLWNVLRGEMSLIGPRPEQVTFVHEFSKEIPFYSWRHRVKPGVTGWAQVQQGYTSGLEDTMIKLEYDLYYVKHVSFWLDLFIALKTVWIMVTGWGAK